MESFTVARQHLKKNTYANFFCFLIYFFTIGCLNKGQKTPLLFQFSGVDFPKSNTVSVPETGKITLNSESRFYVSSNVGAINFKDVSWSPSLDAYYRLRLNATNCQDGTVISEGAVTKSTSVSNRIQANDASNPLLVGANRIILCLDSSETGSNWDKVELDVIRDDTPPTSITFTPDTGIYGSLIPNISLTCSDLGGSGCNKIAYRVGGSDPGISPNGTPDANSISFSNPFSVPDNAITTVKAIAVDGAGNVGTVSAPSVFTVFTGNPTITITSQSAQFLKATTASTIKWKSDIAGTFTFRRNSSYCSDGTPLFSGTVSANVLKTSGVLSTALPADGNYTIRICVTSSLTGNVGYTTFPISKDSVIPTISISPAGNNLNLPVNQRYFTFTFNEDMDTSATLSPSIFMYTDASFAGSTSFGLKGTTGQWLDARTYRLDIQSKLPELSFFQLTVSGFKDFAGNVPASSSFLFGTGVDSTPQKVADTGQTDCSDSNGDPTGCTGSGQDGEIVSASSGLTLPFAMNVSYPSDIVSVDTITGRVWKTCIEGFSWNGTTCIQVCPQDTKWDGTSCLSSTGYPYKNQISTYECNALNSANSGNGYAGKKTWRVPYLSEYYSILNYGGNAGNNAIPEANFPGLPRNNYQRYWTGTSTLSINATTVTGTIDSLSSGPIDPMNSASYYSQGAWAISVFGGVTQPGPDKTRYNSQYVMYPYYYTNLCVAD
ncbi:DUF1566 domain-containing protein [Leptospira stimsonii]|uniref:DUF1566 domain-containing protein n=1 Tax=Leptospira stimsonii TaxID=2202203 RepID=A0ABY2N4F2_9LEPT|nr:DUF1566 domain-containing protein [Leptospira stimsonii]TGK22068.1 DUF1566 domain-containing protein [Leptospira stimsonii]TGM16796.1 DUF1566 domain-containing protein [Leptospira stimsonii]